MTYNLRRRAGGGEGEKGRITVLLSVESV